MTTFSCPKIEDEIDKLSKEGKSSDVNFGLAPRWGFWKKRNVNIVSIEAEYTIIKHEQWINKQSNGYTFCTFVCWYVFSTKGTKCMK